MEPKNIKVAPIGRYGDNEEENQRWAENAEKYRKIIFDKKVEGTLDDASSYPIEELLRTVVFQCHVLFENHILEGEGAHFITVYDKEYYEKYGHNPTFDLLEALYVVDNKKFKEVKYE